MAEGRARLLQNVARSPLDFVESRTRFIDDPNLPIDEPLSFVYLWVTESEDLGGCPAPVSFAFSE